MNVLMTGGSGFVGYWMALTRPQGITVAALNRAGYELMEWTKTKWDAIIHLAPVGVTEVIQCAEASKCPVLYASSGAAFYMRNEYGMNKAKWEIELQSTGLDAKIARLYAFCGARLKWERFAIGSFIKDAEHGLPIRVSGDGTAVRTYMYGQDLGEWMWEILLRGKGVFYEVGSEEPHTILELAQTIAAKYSPQPTIHIKNGIPLELLPRYIPQTRDTREELGVGVKIGYEEAVERTIQDFRREQADGKV